MNKILPTSQRSGKKTAAAISIAVLIIWIIFSAIYMINDQWNDFQLVKMQQAYQNGITDSVRTVMKESDKCSVVPLYYGDQKIDVVAVKCLQQKETETTPDTETEEPKKITPIAPIEEELKEIEIIDELPESEEFEEN